MIVTLRMVLIIIRRGPNVTLTPGTSFKVIPTHLDESQSASASPRHGDRQRRRVAAEERRSQRRSASGDRAHAPGWLRFFLLNHPDASPTKSAKTIFKGAVRLPKEPSPIHQVHGVLFNVPQ